MLSGDGKLPSTKKRGVPADTDSNLLVEPLGPLLDDSQLVRALTVRPSSVGNVQQLSIPERLLQVRLLPILHLPSPVELRLASRIQQMIRAGYLLRAPQLAKTWRPVYNSPSFPMQVPADSALVTGLSGVGKSCGARQLRED